MSSSRNFRNATVGESFGLVGTVVNLIGVIVHHKAPEKCKGPDYHCTVKIIDPSHTAYGLAVSMFCPYDSKLPQVHRQGDIFVVTRVTIKIHNNETYAFYHKLFSSFALYEGIYGQSFIPYQSSVNFHPQQHEKETVAELRKWMDNSEFDLELRKYIMLSEIDKVGKVDLVCKILHCSEINQCEVRMFVWDGTDSPPCNINENPIPLRLEGRRLSRKFLSRFPSVGTVLRVKVEQRTGVLVSKSESVGKWAKIINLDIGLHAGLRFGTFSTSTRIKYVSDGDCHVLQCLSKFENRDKWPITSCLSLPSITETTYESAGLVTLMDIINYSEVTAVFRCVVRVVSMLPFNPKDFFDEKGEYRVRLTLEDPTARIHAYLFGTDAEIFFGGKPMMDELGRKRNTFLGITDCSEYEEAPVDRNPPWMVCGIASYYRMEDKKWETRTYSVFQTKFLG